MCYIGKQGGPKTHSSVHIIILYLEMRDDFQDFILVTIINIFIALRKNMSIEIIVYHFILLVVL